MAISKLEVGVVPLGVGGDSLRSAAAKINTNFSTTSHAASRLVGTAVGNVMEVGAFGLGVDYSPSDSNSNKGGITNFLEKDENASENTPSYQIALTMPWIDKSHTFQLLAGLHNSKKLGFRTKNSTNPKWSNYTKIIHSDNTTIDGNGFIKNASPIVKVYADKIDMNDDAAQQNITFTKNSVGDYTIAGTSGLSTDGWYLEIPKDLNGNPKVAIKLDETDGTIALKCYKRIFNMQTFIFEPDLGSPMDIPDDRWIDIRLNDLSYEQEDGIQEED